MSWLIQSQPLMRRKSSSAKSGAALASLNPGRELLHGAACQPTSATGSLQALCYRCNAMKRDRDDTDFRAVRAAYEHMDAGCPFCLKGDATILLQNSLAGA
jgi:hypothetical protein